jgi:dihydropteroate synthase
MHNRSDPRKALTHGRIGDHYAGVDYEDLLEDVCRELVDCIRRARAAGIADAQIILDPGIGFGKTVDQNLALLNGTDRIAALGFPVLVGPSRKSFIGATLDALPADRLHGTAAAVAVAITRGADMVRVHDTGPMVRVARMTDAIVRR